MSVTLDQRALYRAVDDRRRDLSIRWLAVAEQVGVSRNTISAFKTGSATPRLDTLLGLLVFLGTTDLEPFMKEQ